MSNSSSQPENETAGNPTPVRDLDSVGLFGRYALYLGADLTCRGLRFLADLVLVRHFGQGVFGQLNLAQSLAVQGMGVANCGLDTAGIRDVAANASATSSIVPTVILLRLGLGLITWGSLAALTRNVPQFRDCFELTALFGLSMFTGALTIGWVAQAGGRMHVVSLAMLTTHLVYFGGVQAAAQYALPATSVPLTMLLAEALSAAGLWIWYSGSIGRVGRPLPLPAALKFLRESLPIGCANFLRGLIVGSDIVLLGLFVAESDVGLYSGAYKLYSLGLSLTGLYCAVLLPQLAACAARSLSNVRSTLRASMRRTLLAGAPLLLIALASAGAVLQFLFRPDFAAATRSLQVLLVALPASLAAGHYRAALIALGRQQLDLRLVAVGALVHVGVKLCLIPLFGISGAAWGTMAGEAALMLLSWGVVRTLLGKPSAVPD